MVEYLERLFAAPFATLTPEQREAVLTWCPPGMEIGADTADDAMDRDEPDEEDEEDDDAEDLASNLEAEPEAA